MASFHAIILCLATFVGISTSTNLDSTLGEDLAVSIIPQSLLEVSRNDSHRRVKRQLITFPKDSVLQFEFELELDYWKIKSAKASGKYTFELKFKLPTEKKSRRKKRSLVEERTYVYGMLGDALTKAGLDGEACVSRAVCEIGESPLDEYGVFGEIINLFFTPGYRSENENSDYFEAEDYGRSFGNCWSAFPECPISMREMLYDFLLTNAVTHEHC